MQATRSLPKFAGSLLVRPSSVRSGSLVACRAQDKPAEKATKEIYESTEKVVADLKDKWEKTDEKPSVIALGVAGIVGIWVLNGVATALDSLPLFSGIFQLVGIFVTGWFTYRYLVFAPDREELKANVKTFASKVQGKTT